MASRLCFSISLFFAICLLQFSPGTSREHDASDVISNDLFLNNIAEEDMKDEGLEVPETSGSPDIETDAPENVQEDCSPAARRNTDKYVDKVLEEVRPKLPEPAFLPERVGRFRLFNGTLSNLITLKRSGPALVRCTDDTFSFLVPIGLRNLTGRYFWETDAGVPVFRGIIDMAIEHADADVLFTRTRGHKHFGQKAKVDKLTITRLQGVKLKFDGLGPLNVVASRFTNLVARFFSRGVSRALEGPVRNAINRELKNVEKYEYYYF